MDIVGILKIIGLIIGAFFLYSIAASPGIEGKLFVLLIIGIGVWWYMRGQAASQVMNPVQVYHERMARACELKGKKGLRYLVFSGDAHNQRYVKGEILGGPLRIADSSIEKIPVKWKEFKNKFGDSVKEPVEFKYRYKYPKDHPWHYRYVFLYTPSYGVLYDIPFIGGFFAAMRRKCLITAFEPQLRSTQMIGDVELKGVNSLFVEQMEFVSDEMFDYDFEMKHLSSEVERLTLGDELAMLPTRIRKAIDSNSDHNKLLDLKDIPVSIGGGSNAT